MIPGRQVGIESQIDWGFLVSQVDVWVLHLNKGEEEGGPRVSQSMNS